MHVPVGLVVVANGDILFSFHLSAEYLLKRYIHPSTVWLLLDRIPKGGQGKWVFLYHQVSKLVPYPPK